MATSILKGRSPNSAGTSTNTTPNTSETYTLDNAAPTVVTLSPGDNASGRYYASDISITFNDSAIQRGVGDFVEQLAREQGTTGAQVEKEFFAHVRPTSLIKRFSTTHEVASMVAYLASPLASSTTGAALRVDGGTVKSAF